MMILNIQCEELIYKYKLNKEAIENQLLQYADSLTDIYPDMPFIFSYRDDVRYMLTGEICDNTIFLLNIIKGKFHKCDNSELFKNI